MKLNGEAVEEENIETVVIPRPKKSLGFKFGPVIDFTEFDQLCPMPKPPIISLPNGKTKLGLDLPQFAEKRMAYAEKKTAWMFLKSIAYTPDLEWEMVDMGDPETWLNYDAELRKAKITQAEIDLLMGGFARANSMDQRHLDEARESFLASLEEKAPQSEE